MAKTIFHMRISFTQSEENGTCREWKHTNLFFSRFASMIDSFRRVVLSGVDLIGRYCGVQLKKIAVFLWSGNEHYADN